ncbi:MAG: histidinol-phosphate transaminase, partial [Actinomycetes bacterium]
DDLALMDGYHSPQVRVDVRLNTNEAPEGPPPAFTDAVAAAVRAIDWHRYPDRSAAVLRRRIAEVEGASAGVEFGAANVLAANGSNEVLQTVLLAYGGPGRSAAVFEPTYALHSHIARLTGTEVVGVDRSESFELQVDRASDLIRSAAPAVTFLCSPNNPTGIVESAQTVTAILDAVESVDGLLVVDEAYGQFANWSACSLVSEDRNLVVTRTYSKTWSAAALRLGYLIGPTWVVSALDEVVLPYHLDAFTQAAGLVALDFHDQMRDRVRRLTGERHRVVEALHRLGVEQWPSGANFVLFRPGAADAAAADAIWQGLVDRSVLVRNCASWPRLDGCLRVTIGTPEENDRFLAALADVLHA